MRIEFKTCQFFFAKALKTSLYLQRIQRVRIIVRNDRPTLCVKRVSSSYSILRRFRKGKRKPNYYCSIKYNNQLHNRQSMKGLDHTRPHAIVASNNMTIWFLPIGASGRGRVKLGKRGKTSTCMLLIPMQGSGLVGNTWRHSVPLCESIFHAATNIAKLKNWKKNFYTVDAWYYLKILPKLIISHEL